MGVRVRNGDLLRIIEVLMVGFVLLELAFGAGGDEGFEVLGVSATVASVRCVCSLGTTENWSETTNLINDTGTHLFDMMRWPSEQTYLRNLGIDFSSEASCPKLRIGRRHRNIEPRGL